MTLEEALKKWEESYKAAIEGAFKDAIIFGEAQIKVNPDGSLNHIPIKFEGCCCEDD